MTDETVRRALARIDESYVEPGRIAPRRMLEGALRSADGRFETVGVEALELPGGLVERLAPALEQALELDGPESREQRRAALLSGALGTLDRYSRAVSGTARMRFLDRYTGTICGIGVRIGRREGRIQVLHCVEGGAAHGAGVLPGDELAAVDGRSLKGKLVVDALRALRGPRGTTVTLTLDRRPPVDLPIARRSFARSSVSAGIGGDGVAWLRLARMSKTTPREVDRWIASIPAASRPAGLVLDLRGNKGGSMLAAAAVADRFVSTGTLVEALDRAGVPVPGLTSRVDAGEGAKLDWPLAVLLDGATSSAAELLAAALAWNDRAILVGQRSFGKTTVMKLYHYPQDDLTLRLAVGYMRAAGRRLEPDGIVPDVVLDTGDGENDAAPAVARRMILEHGRVSRSDWLSRVSRG